MIDLEIALAMEQKGAAFYEDLAERAEQPLTRELFSILAADERNHERIFRNLAEARDLPPDNEIRGTDDVESRVRRVFARLGEQARADVDKVEGLEAALTLERDSYDYYRDAAAKAADERTRRFYQALMQQESEHYEAIDNVLQYLKNPGDWFMNQESERWNWMNT